MVRANSAMPKYSILALTPNMIYFQGLYCPNANCKWCEFGDMLDLEHFTQGNRNVRNCIASVASK